MGNFYSSLERCNMKCFSTAKKLPEASKKTSNTQKTCDPVNKIASDVHISHCSSRKFAKNERFLMKSNGRYWFPRIRRSISYRSEGQRHHSEKAAQTDDFRLCDLPSPRSKSFLARSFSENDSKTHFLPNLEISTDFDKSDYPPIIEEETPDNNNKCSRPFADNRNVLLGQGISYPLNGTYPLRHHSGLSGFQSVYCRQSRLNNLPHSSSVDSSVATETPITCTLIHYPPVGGNNKAFPFLPGGTAYLLSDEQHRLVEQTLCSTKLLLHRLKRLLIETYANEISQSAPLSNHDVDVSYVTYSRFSFDFAHESSNSNDALRGDTTPEGGKVGHLEESAMKDAFIQHYLQKIS